MNFITRWFGDNIYWQIALRYMFYKRKQTFISVITIISVAGVSVGVMALIIVISVMSGFEADLQSKILGTNSHVIVLKHAGGMSEYEQVIDKIKKKSDTGVTGLSPFVYSQAMVTSDTNMTGAVVYGIDTNRVASVSSLRTYIQKGKIDDIDRDYAGAGGVSIGAELAKNLGLTVGSIINIVSPMGEMGPTGSMPKIAKFRVVAIFSSGMYEYDSSFVYISLRAAQEFFNLGTTVTGVEIRIKDIYKAKATAWSIEKLLGYPYWTKDWMEMNRNLFSALRLEKIVMFIILLLIIFVASFNIASTLIMMVMEKHKDIGILRTMGMSKGGIGRVFTIHGLLIGLVGSLIGTTLGVALCLILKKWQFIKLPTDVYYISRLPVLIDPLTIAIIAVSAVAVAFVATLYPSRQATRIDPNLAIRGE